MGFLDKLLSRRGYDTMFGRAHVVVMPASDGRRVRILELGGTFQSASFEGSAWAELPFAYFKGFDAIFQAKRADKPMKSVLLLGGGGFAWPKHALTEHDDLHLDVVEIDPAIVDIARKHFYLDRLEHHLVQAGTPERLRISIDDASHFLLGCSDVYDAIINDVFQGSATPESTSTNAFFAQIKHHLSPGGIYAQNIVTDLTREGGRSLFNLVSKLEETFLHAWAVDATDPEFGGADNYIIMASDADYPFDGCMDCSG